jgi:hypothetical protein
MSLARFLLRYISWLSLDVVIGAMAGMYFFMELFHTRLQWQAFALLGLAVWSIYTFDHLVDVKKIHTPLSDRRAFLRNFQNSFWMLLGVAVAIGLSGALLWFGWGKELQLTLIIAILMVGSRLMVRILGPGWMKEFSIAVFYVIGIVWLPLLRAEEADITWLTLVFLPGYMLLAFLNLLMLSFLDREEDMKAGFLSIASAMSPQKILVLIRQLAFGMIFLSLAGFILLPSFFRPFSCILLLIALLHYLTFFSVGLNSLQKRQRMEMAFWLPWLLFLL